MHFTDEGQGLPLLFVHGWTCDSNDFLGQLAFFRSRYRVIAPDLRGHGRSSVLADGYEARRFARDLIELLDMLGIDACYAIGHSLGGLVVSAMAVEYPDRVRGVVCLDPVYGVPDSEIAAWVEKMQLPDWRQMLVDDFGRCESRHTPVFFRELHRRRVLTMDAAVVQSTFNGMFLGPDPLAPRSRAQTYLVGRLCPVLGIYSFVGPERARWEKLHAKHPESRTVHLPVGHWPQQDAPYRVNRLIKHWLENVSKDQK